jgi:hypothetical protein
VDQSLESGITNTREVSDTIVEVMRNASSNAYGASFNGAGITAFLLNNANYKAWGDSVSANVQVYAVQNGASITAANYNLSYTPSGTPTHTTPWTNQANPQTNANPSFVSVSTDDFTLGGSAGVGARGTGGALTTTNGSGTGATFTVSAGGGGFFRGFDANITQYNSGLTAGDVITVGTDVLTVASISGDTVTVTASFTWSNGESIYLGDSTSPDIGAFPYKAGGYTLSASYTITGGTATITPNDASLIRFVVCYSNGVPYAVDNSSPYTCATPPGPFSARVYPIYASKTLWTVATP